MRILITGITGFAGSHLAEYCLAQGAEVYGTFRWRSKTDNIEHLRDSLDLIECDLRELMSVSSVIKRSQPDWIFHLAAQSFVPTSWHAPGETLMSNTLCQVNIFEAVRLHDMHPRIQIAGSSEEYGLCYADEVPIKESNPFRPLSPYAVSKVSQDLLGYQYFKSHGMAIVRTRAFNHTGPRRPANFVTSSFAKQIVDVETGRTPPVIKVGNLSAIRDFTDVRDMVRAYWLALDKGESGEVYNIASGTGYRIQEVLDMLLDLSHVKVEVKEDPERLRPSDVPVLVGDSTKFRELTGWEPQIPFEQTLEDMLDYWRASAANGTKNGVPSRGTPVISGGFERTRCVGVQQ
ncbi:MAG: GDP-mannose 4,6-dehydratase [Chloroflexi bacterium]|nr:GDP-mannose 4,6-dehydratase [Chloroflexota bacterium]